MKNIFKTLVLCTLSTSLYAESAKWAERIDANKTSLITTSIESPQVNLNKETASFSYKLNQDEKLNFDVAPFEEISKQYWLDSSGSKLLDGINLPVTGGDTVIRISPLTNNKNLQLKSDMIELQNNGKAMAVNVFADSAQLKATGAAFSDNSIALKVSAEAGQINLKVDNFAEDTPFVVHVFEPKSNYALTLKTTQSTYDANQKISINTKLLFGNEKLDSELQGYINRPDGSVLGNLEFFKDSDGKYLAELDAIGAQGLAQGLWEVHVFAKGHNKGVDIMRDAQTSFAVNLNTAQFDGTLVKTDQNLKVGIDVGLEGRYEVRGVIMGTDAKTFEQKPIAMTMAASWLAKGSQSIELAIEEKLIKGSGLIAPFSLKNVQLTNQTFMAPVQTVKSGIILQ